MSKIEQIDALIDSLKTLRKEVIKRDKMSTKAALLTIENSSDKRRGKARVDLNWQSMHVDQKATDVARLFEGSCCDVGTEEKFYNPSGMHEYIY